MRVCGRSLFRSAFDLECGGEVGGIDYCLIGRREEQCLWRCGMGWCQAVHMCFFDETSATGFRGAFNGCSWRPRALTLARRSEDRKAVIIAGYLVTRVEFFTACGCLGTHLTLGQRFRVAARLDVNPSIPQILLVYRNLSSICYTVGATHSKALADASLRPPDRADALLQPMMRPMPPSALPCATRPILAIYFPKRQLFEFDKSIRAKLSRKNGWLSAFVLCWIHKRLHPIIPSPSFLATALSRSEIQTKIALAYSGNLLAGSRLALWWPLSLGKV
ncbi:hypothetical protein B0H14DRAFT_477482 [Mycena olivaceomarginata]|nr:hypothetical protein B0H14DRAFT_477482 [Mycena olivaceomarginata]